MNTGADFRRLDCADATACECRKGAPAHYSVPRFWGRSGDEFVPAVDRVTEEPRLVFAIDVPTDVSCGWVPRSARLSVVLAQLVTDVIPDITQSCARVKDHELFVSREETHDATVDVEPVVVAQTHACQIRQCGLDRVVSRALSWDDVDITNREHYHANRGRHESLDR